MRTAIEQNILSTVHELPVDKQQQILEFSLFLKQQLTIKQNVSNGALDKDVSLSWSDSVKALAGAWQDAPFAEELRSEEGQDIPRESF